MKKIYILLLFVLYVALTPLLIHHVQAAGLCDQFASESDRAVCNAEYALYSRVPGDVALERDAVKQTILSTIDRNCAGAGLTAAVCTNQSRAAEAAVTSCINSGGSVGDCQSQANQAAQRVSGVSQTPQPPQQTPSGTCTADNIPVLVGGVTMCRDRNGQLFPSIQTPQRPQVPVQTQQTTCTGPNCGNLGYVPLEPIGFDLSGIQNTNQNAFGEWLSFLLKIAISIGGLVAVVMLVFGGVVYMVSEVVDRKHEALERIQASFLGLFILIASWLILNTINPQLVTGTNFFRITPSSGTSVSPPASTPPATQQSIQQAVNECLARSASRTCVYVHGQSGPECRC